MKLLYPLGAICFTRKQCAKIQARYLPTFYPKWASGIKRTIRPRQFCMGHNHSVEWTCSISKRNSQCNTQHWWFQIFEGVTSLVGRMLQTSMSMGVLPEASYSIQDPLGAVWIHVRKKGSTEMEPGLYYSAGRAYDELHSARREIITLW